MTVISIGGIEGLGAITGFSGSITGIWINGIQVYPTPGSIELEPNKTMTIKIAYSVTPSGDIAWNDSWTVGVTAKMGSQFGWDSTQHTGSGTKTATPEIGNLKSPTTDSTLVIKLYAIDATKPTAPPG